MIQSMTGFATKTIILEQDGNKIKLSISIKSLNSRYFDITCKLPFILNQLETELTKIIKTKLHRGHAYLTMHLSDHNAFKTSIEPAIATINGYIEATNQIQKKFGLSGNITINDVMNLPNVFLLEEKSLDEKSKELIIKEFNSLLEDLIIERSKEGQELKKDIDLRLKFMWSKIEQIEQLFQKSINEHKEKISKKVQEINEINHEFAETQRQALYLLLDKMDIHEEIVRFKSHLQNIQKIIDSKAEEKGKQLDFVLQELSREINTITAKTPNHQIIESAIAIKVDLEKAREQTQNIV